MYYRFSSRAMLASAGVCGYAPARAASEHNRHAEQPLPTRPDGSREPDNARGEGCAQPQWDRRVRSTLSLEPGHQLPHHTLWHFAVHLAPQPSGAHSKYCRPRTRRTALVQRAGRAVRSQSSPLDNESVLRSQCSWMLSSEVTQSAGRVPARPRSGMSRGLLRMLCGQPLIRSLRALQHVSVDRICSSAIRCDLFPSAP